MNTKRTIATMAALGGFTAAIALSSGMPSAKADELSDLRANQQLLQERVDQLSQAIPAPGAGGGLGPGGAYGGGPPSPVAGQPSAAGSFPRSFLIPGTDTSIRVGGEIREDVVYYLSGGTVNGSPQSDTIGITGQVESAPLNVHALGVGFTPAYTRSDGIFQQTPRESKINFETRTPTAWGEVRTFMEFDWAGSGSFLPGSSNGALGTTDSLVPRLRFAYGTLGGLLAGQANSNFADPDASAETIDFGGNAGDPGWGRIPQVRYTMPLAQWGLLGAFSVSAETPETSTFIANTIGGAAAGNYLSSDSGANAVTNTVVPTTTCTAPVLGTAPTCTTSAVAGNLPLVGGTNIAKATAPNLTAAWFIPQPWGHIDFSAVLLPGIELSDGEYFSRDYIGYGGHVGGDVKPGWFGFAKDDITFQVVAGDGISRYLNATTNFEVITNYPFAAPGTPAAAAAVAASITREYGGDAGYQHFWADNLRSTISGGIQFHDVPNLGGADGFVCAGASTAAPKATGTAGCAINKELVTGHANLIWNPVPFVDLSIEYNYGHRVVLSNEKGDVNALLSRMRVQF